MRLTVLLVLVSLASAIRAEDAAKVAAAQVERARLEEILSAHPADALIRYKLGLVYRELGDNRKATMNLQAAMRGGFDNLAARLNLIEAAFACRQSTLALATAQQVISTTPKSPGVLLRVGRLLFDHLFYKESLRAFQLAQQAAPDAFEPRFRLALTDYLLRDYAATVAALEPVARTQSTPEAASLMASAEAELGRFETAIPTLQWSIATVPKSPHAYINLALIELDRGNGAKSETILEQFRALQSQSDAKVFYSVRRNSCGEIANAVANGAVPALVSHDKAEFYYQLAAQLEERFNFLSAVQLIRLAQLNEGNSARVLLVAGTSCLNHDPMAPEPIMLLRQALARDPNLDKAYFLLGRAYTHQGKLEDAAAAYRKAAELRPEASYYVSLGKALRNRQNAIPEFERALALDNSSAQAHLELGRAYVQLEEFGKARPHLEKAIELEPDYYEAYYLLGRLLHKIGDEEQSHTLLAQFAEKKNALMQQSVIGAGYIGDGN